MMESSLLSYIPSDKFMTKICTAPTAVIFIFVLEMPHKNKIINVLDVDVCIWNGVFVSLWLIAVNW
jgi:hypothetical protein